LLLVEDAEGTRIKYTYFVTVRHRWMRPAYAWLVRVLALPFWKRSFVDPLESLVESRRAAEAHTHSAMPAQGEQWSF